MPERDDQLIAEFNARRSDDAFAALVRQHIHLVFATALRQVGDPGAAEEITQNVFVALARAAGKLGSHPTIAGWLHQTALNKSREWLRSELRRRRREQVAVNLDLARAEGDSVWSPLVPLLDEALLELREPDRQAVLLHFMEGQTFGEVGATLGLGEDAARKRVHRCLGQLTGFFRRRGFAVPALTAGAPLFAMSSQAVPAGLATSAGTAAMAAGHAAASSSTLTLIKGALKIMAWTKAKTAVVAGVALILTTGTSVVVITRMHSMKTVHLTLSGLPETAAELNAWYVEPPAGQNAATFYLQGIKAMQLNGADQIANLPIMGKLLPPPLGTPLPPAVKSALTDFLQRNREALQFFAQGAQYEQSRYPIDLAQGPNTPLPHLMGVKRGMQMAEMAAILDAENNDGKSAADDVLMSMALARSLNAEPLLISQLVRAAGVALSAAGLEQIVNRTSLSPESLSELSKAFQSMEQSDASGEGFNRAVTGERAIHLELLRNPDRLVQYLNASLASGTPDEQDRRMAEEANQPAVLKAEQDYFESTFEQILSLRQEPLPARSKVDELIRQRAAKATSQGLLLNGLYWSGFTGGFSREASCLANLRLALTAVALQQFRAAHNHYPAALSELTPNYLAATPEDPFDGRPLRYRQQGAGYLLYSIGPDLKDNGGRPMTGKGGDMVFTVITPPAP